MKALVTGGGGFLGGAIVRQLVERGDEVISYSRGRYLHLAELGVRHIQGDLASREGLCRAMEGCDTVFHTGAKAGAWGRYADYYRANVVGTENVLKACVKTGIGRLVYTSSPSVVFAGGGMEGVDESVPYAESFKDPYPRTKAIAEKMVMDINDDRLATVSLRPHLIWGPGDNHIVPRLVSKARAGRLMIVGTGRNRIDTVYIDNAAQAHLKAADRLFPGSRLAGRAYFISNGDPRPIKEIINRIMEAYGLPPVRRHIPAGIAYAGGWLFEMLYHLFRLKGEPLVTRFLAEEFSTPHWFNISAARHDFEYVPGISFDEGMRLLGEYAQRTGTAEPRT